MDNSEVCFVDIISIVDGLIPPVIEHAARLVGQQIIDTLKAQEQNK